jgi:hypothetical protein
MHIPGHLATALAQHRLLTLSGRADAVTLPPLLVASLLPDVVDKAVGYVFCLMPNGRHYAHNIFSLLGLSLVVMLLWGRVVGLAWFVGYLGHLLADGDGFLPWFFPVKRYQFYAGRLKFKPLRLLKETIFLAVVLVIYYATRPPEQGETA